MKINRKKLTGQAVVSKALLPIGCAVLGAIAGQAVGKTFNLAVAAGLAGLGIVTDRQNLVFAGAGAAVVTPSAPTPTSGIGGLEGYVEFAEGAKNRAVGYAKSVLSNAKLDFIANKLPGTGLSGLDQIDVYDSGYMAGVTDAAEEMAIEGNDLSGFYSPGRALGTGESQSIEAMMLRQRLAA